MARLKKIELDILKPHLPNALEFATAIADLHPDYRVLLDVVEMDEKTETLAVVVQGEDLEYAPIEQVIQRLGGSIHSIDKVEVTGEPAAKE